ncbi:MarR family winged helix-turn-helix transcriptional regulator [Micromonospora sp. KC207]|uniref:MarR family winged helix-turn-helix transcriptional regulator n=1 Tax=Micromonospora sp. KC207 TaxID=2530377 RepID=UPI001AA0013E|nr:hypothetical protein [Micromonospora sp. KC207]
MVSSTALTNRIDRLVDRGLVDRAVDPGHRRRVLISLTTDGMNLVNELVERHPANERHLLDGLTPADQAHLARLLRRLLTSLGDCASGYPAGCSCLWGAGGRVPSAVRCRRRRERARPSSRRCWGCRYG